MFKARLFTGSFTRSGKRAKWAAAAVASLGMLGGSGLAQANMVLVDFGSTASDSHGGTATTMDTSGRSWNNFSKNDNDSSGTDPISLQDTAGSSTGYSLGYQSSDHFKFGIHGDYPTPPAGSDIANLGYPSSATGDSLFINSVVTQVTLRLSGLSLADSYSFTFFGAREGVSDTRIAQFSVDGLTGDGSATLLEDDNNQTGGNVASVNNVTANPDVNNPGFGTIDLTVSRAPNNISQYIHLNVLQIDSTPVPEPASLALLGLGGLLLVSRRKGRKTQG